MKVNRFVVAAFGAAFLSALGLAVFASPSQAQDQVTVPTTVGQTTTVTWQDTILPGVNTSSECGAADAGASTHEIDILVPDGTYDQVNVQATATINYSGPVDVIVTVVLPDGSKISGDQGFVDTPESVGFVNPEPGVYRVIACMFAGVVPQSYTGSLELQATDAPIATSSRSCGAPGKSLQFTAPSYVDTERAGGEPSVVAHPDGTLLYASHAGTTHFYAPDAPEGTEAFEEHYRGQVHAYYSDDNGRTWHFVDRTLPPNLVGSGFSDPDFAIDAAGNTYLSEINLANVSMSGSSDSGHSYESRNFFAETITDRQWSAAGPSGVVFLDGNADEGGTFPTDPVGNDGHLIYRSTDGGRTFSEAVEDPGGLGDIVFDQGSQTLYEAHYEGSSLIVAAFRNSLVPDAQAALTPEKHTIADGVNMLSHWPAIDVDSAGNLYIAWDEAGNGAREAGVWYSHSTDGGRTWAAPVRVDPDNRTDIWPWIAVGDPGRVAVAWFGNDSALPANDAEQAGTNDGWNVYVAQTTTGLGCSNSSNAGFKVTRATPQPFHTGTVCMGGTVCQAQLVDRRLGDYFTIDVDTKGALVAAYSDTRQGGAVALPAFFRQSGGTTFFASGHQKPSKK
jgi:hypothetical protein